MPLDAAIRLTEILMSVAFLQQSLEHLRGPKSDALIFWVRIVLSLLLLVGFATPLVCVALLITALFMLQRFQGPYNGGSDRMSLLILCCLCVVHVMPSHQWKEYAFGYLALQLLLSYFIAGWVKVVNPDWRNGQALRDVFLFSAYPVSEEVRTWSNKPSLLKAMSWLVMLFELLFPLALVTQTTLIVGLIIGACFHLANACLFGLNRFLWIWLAGYPSLIWLQSRIIYS